MSLSVGAFSDGDGFPVGCGDQDWDSNQRNVVNVSLFNICASPSGYLLCCIQSN